MARNNPLNIITPDAFAVAPQLLGIALARPSRRLIAIAIDGILLAILAHLGGKLLFTIATAFLLWRAAATFTGGSQSTVKTALRIASVVLLTIFLSLMYGRVTRLIAGFGAGSDENTAPDGAAIGAATAADAAGIDSIVENSGLSGSVTSGNVDFKALGLSFRDARVMMLLGAIEKAEDSATAAPLADSLARWIDARPTETRPQLANAFGTALEDAPGYPAVAGALARHLPVDTFPPGDTLRRELAATSAHVAQLERENRKLKEEAEDAEEGFTFKKLLNTASDVAGFGLGWSALYFTGFLLLMRGQTPGKKLLGIRVIRLDGRPLSAWIAFERFGGYAASTATGLLGFAQILWDRNRQALHDKATETVVIREHHGMPLRPTPADHPSV